jgi:adenylate cyclase
MTKSLTQGSLIGLAGGAAALLLAALGLLNWIENPSWDARVQLFARPSPCCDQIRLIFLDQTSLDWGKDVNKWSWPWYREVYAGILSFCRRGGAKAVAFDVLFSEPSSSGALDDAALASSVSQTPGFVAAATFSTQQGMLRRIPANLALRTPTVGGLAEWSKTPAGLSLAAPLASLPIPEIAGGAALVGNVSTSLSGDTVIRRMVPGKLFDGRFFPSLGLAAYLVARPKAKLRLSGNDLWVDGRRVPMDDRGEVILRYRGPSQTHKTVSVQAVLQSQVRLEEGGRPVLDPSFFRDAYVFFGLTAPGLHDVKASPTSTDENRAYPGVEVQATFLDNLLADDFIRPAQQAAWVGLTLVLAIVAGLLGRMSRTGWQTALTFSLLPVPFAAGAAAYADGFWLPVAPATVGVALALVSTAVLNYALEGRQKRFIKGAFRQYLSPAVIDRLVQHPESLKLGGELRELSIHFSDVAGFTTISESLSPHDLTALLNEYLTAMSDIIMEEGGTVDKYEGDAVVAFWNAPLDLPGHANYAVRAALRCQRKLCQLRPVLKAKYGHELYCRAGINTGKVVIGNMGSHQRFNYTFLGDAGNLASRLEGLNKQFGTAVLISEFTRRQLSDEFAAREIARVRVAGKSEPVCIFEPILRADAEARAGILKAFAAALESYYAGRFQEAVALFERTAGSDSPARAYAERCRLLAAAPPAFWDGIWVLTEK